MKYGGLIHTFHCCNNLIRYVLYLIDAVRMVAIFFLHNDKTTAHEDALKNLSVARACLYLYHNRQF